ncbi:MAG: hypothetical protein DSZ21_00630 [Tenericutes bacterium]|nr:MAG: hypothetical protein DSZ21_00630 [Mycoplasmatota bacterium]
MIIDALLTNQDDLVDSYLDLIKVVVIKPVVGIITPIVITIPTVADVESLVEINIAIELNRVVSNRSTPHIIAPITQAFLDKASAPTIERCSCFP